MPKYGLIGQSLQYSFSPAYFAQKFEQLQRTNCSYKVYSMPNVDAINALIIEERLKGFNVTIPFKTAILPYLDGLDPSAKKVGAVNTVKVHWEGEHFHTIGYNTDIVGFKQSLVPLLAKGSLNALVLGSGGASKAVVAALNALAFDWRMVSRQQKGAQFIAYPDLTEALMQSHTLLVNCTPLGTAPNTEEMPDIPWQHLGPNHLVYDLIYNPEKSLLLRKAEAQGASIKNGLEMLQLQADATWDIWQTAQH